MAEAGATPATGNADQLEIVDEVKTEIFCGSRQIAQAAVAALKEVRFGVRSYD